MSEYVKWGVGCPACAFTGDEYADGWTGRPCPHCLRDDPVEPDSDDNDNEPAPPCFLCGEIIEGWAHRDAEGYWYCDECCNIANWNELVDGKIPF